jgi:Raf kinase inhibitor-like YbhB/YbcL family protein
MHHRDAGSRVVLLVPWFRIGALAGLLVSACSSGGDGTPAASGGAGGSNGSGGKVGSGGAPGGTGGAGSGGATATGGSPGSAGAGGSGGTSSGGSSGSGGASTGGSGGSPADAAPTETGGSEVPVGTGPMMLTSSVFTEGGDVPKKYRCRVGDNVSPPLSWTPGPAGTLSYAVTMYHTKSVHWMMWDIPADTTSLPEGIMRLAEPPIPAGAKQVKPNVDGSTWYGYSGPCPGSPNQSYQYYVYALKVAKLPVTTESAPAQIDTALQASKLERAQLVGTASP